MVTRQALEKHVFKTLSEYPRLVEFFQAMLKDRIRVSNPDWLENELIQVLLKNYTPSLDLVDGLLANAEAQHETLLLDMAQDINGKAAGFDGALSDKLAEFNGISWLKQNQYSQIKRIPTTVHSRTPEFEASKNGESILVEVKNLRKVTDLQELTFRKLEAQRFLYPDRFDALTLNIATSTTLGQITEADHKNIETLVGQVNDGRIASECSVAYKVHWRGQTIERSVRCKWQAGRGTIVGHPQAVWTNDKSRLKELRWLLEKTWRKVADGIDQLEEYDSSDRNKWVLLNWIREPVYWFDTEAADVFKDLVSDIDSQVKRIDTKLHIVLL